jgi:hypothetical protein
MRANEYKLHDINLQVKIFQKLRKTNNQLPISESSFSLKSNLCCQNIGGNMEMGGSEYTMLIIHDMYCFLNG